MLDNCAYLKISYFKFFLSFIIKIDTQFYICIYVYMYINRSLLRVLFHIWKPIGLDIRSKSVIKSIGCSAIYKIYIKCIDEFRSIRFRHVKHLRDVSFLVYAGQDLLLFKLPRDEF